MVGWWQRSMWIATRWDKLSYKKSYGILHSVHRTFFPHLGLWPACDSLSIQHKENRLRLRRCHCLSRDYIEPVLFYNISRCDGSHVPPSPWGNSQDQGRWMCERLFPRWASNMQVTRRLAHKSRWPCHLETACTRFEPHSLCLQLSLLPKDRIVPLVA